VCCTGDTGRGGGHGRGTVDTGGGQAVVARICLIMMIMIITVIISIIIRGGYSEHRSGVRLWS